MALLLTLHTPAFDGQAGPMTRHEFELGEIGDECALARAFGSGKALKNLQAGKKTQQVSISGLRDAPNRTHVASRLQAIYGSWSRDQFEDLITACTLAKTHGARASIAHV